MKKIILLSVLIVYAQCCFLFGGSNIIGKWYSEQRNNEGLGAVIQFESDGTFKYITAAITEYNYKIGKDSIHFSFIPFSNKFKSIDVFVPYRFNKDTLLLYPDDSARVQKLVKIGKVKNPIDIFNGTWKYKHEKGYEATWQFTSKHIAQNIVRLKTEDGKYKNKKGSLEMKFSSNKMEDPLFKLNGNSLVLTSKKRKTSEKFLRLEP